MQWLFPAVGLDSGAHSISRVPCKDPRQSRICDNELFLKELWIEGAESGGALTLRMHFTNRDGWLLPLLRKAMPSARNRLSGLKRIPAYGSVITEAAKLERTAFYSTIPSPRAEKPPRAFAVGGNPIHSGSTQYGVRKDHTKTMAKSDPTSGDKASKKEGTGRLDEPSATQGFGAPAEDIFDHHTIARSNNNTGVRMPHGNYDHAHGSRERPGANEFPAGASRHNEGEAFTSNVYEYDELSDFPEPTRNYPADAQTGIGFAGWNN
ncbi:MAG: hypothetical protein GF344_01635 [Chitinivibrionales bacterium]|nr:hypothetical protein [Chitinivibrionales bacterium]MBD3355792.1 hypothetical protein [Chitinivibrionales bacterium]